MSITIKTTDENPPVDSNATWEVFSRKTGLIFLWMPYIITSFFFVVFFLSPNEFKSQKRIIDLIVDIFLLDVTHTVLSWPLLMLPEVKQWKSEYNKKSNFGVRYIIIFFGLFFTISLTGNYYFKWSDELQIYGLLLFAVLPHHHTCTQFKGISIALSTAWQRSAPEKIPAILLEKIIKIEGLGYWLLISGGICWRLVQFKILKESEQAWVTPLSFSLISCGLLIIFYTIFLFPKEFYKRKLAYSGRAFLSPLGLTAWGSLAIQAVHGFEYAFITRQMVKNSASSEKIKKNTYIAMVLLAILVSVVSILVLIRHFQYFNFQLPAWLIGLLLLLRSTNTFTHYWFDGNLFRMKNKESRSYIAPLFYKKSPASN